MRRDFAVVAVLCLVLLSIVSGSEAGGRAKAPLWPPTKVATESVHTGSAICDRLYSRYFSCFRGKNFIRCAIRRGADWCRDESTLARAMADATLVFNPTCDLVHRRIIEKHIEGFRRDFGCVPQ